MKKITLSLIILLISTFVISQDDPVLLKIDNEEYHASEFMYIYSKNNPNPSFQKDSLSEYMELFINYKLKIKEIIKNAINPILSIVGEFLGQSGYSYIIWYFL